MKFFLTGLSFSFLLLMSCSTSKKLSFEGSSAKVHVPDSLAALPPSEIDIPIRIYGPPLLARTDSLVPKEFNSDNWPNYSQPSCDFRYKYHFVRSALKLTCSNNKISVQFTGSYQLSGSKCICTLDKPVSPWVSGSCGYGQEPLRKIVVSLSSRLAFLPYYKLKTQTQLDNLYAIDRCVVSLFSSDVTSLVVDSVRSSVNAFCASLDATLAGMDFSKTLLQLYQQHRVTALGKYGYLTLNPTAVRLGKLNYIKDTFSISVGITCQPELSSDSTKIRVSQAFPYLNNTENRNAVSAYLNANYEYAFLSKLLEDTLKNRAFTINGRTIVVKDAGIKGIGHHQIEIRISFAGTNKGRIYIRGTPVLDVVNQILTMPDISYTLEDVDFALKIARALFSNKIKKNLQGKSYLDVGALVKTNMPRLNETINRQLAYHVLSAGNLNEVKLIGLLAEDDGMHIQLHASANMTFIVTDIP